MTFYQQFSLNDQYDLTRKIFAQNLKSTRLNYGASTKDISNWLQIGERNYKKFEESGSNGLLPKTKYLPIICQNLNVSSDELLGIESITPVESGLNVNKLLLKYKQSQYFEAFLLLCERHNIDDLLFKDLNSIISRFANENR